MFLRGEKRDGYPRLAPFSPLHRCYHGEVTEHNDQQKFSGHQVDTEESEEKRGCFIDGKCVVKKCSIDKDKCTMTCKGQCAKENSDSWQGHGTVDFAKNGQTLSTELDKILIKYPTDVCRNARQNQRVKFHNPPRVVFNLAVKVSIALQF